MQSSNMTDPPHLLKPKRHSWSPTRHRLSDDILAHLSPASAVDALATATGALRTSLSGASPSERDFAMRTAMASKTVWEWVSELQDWSWPSEGGPAGFEMPNRKNKRFSVQVTAPEGEDNEYMGSLRSEHVVKYEQRIAQIRKDLEGLEIEDIKTQVLSNHILPLSRPGTPLFGPGRAGLAATYNKLEDISAVVTAIVMQALPNLAKLSRLLQTWNIRLTILHRVPGLLLAIEDAEVALKSGWNAISKPSKNPDSHGEPTLTRNDFDIMRLVLEKKISKPGRSLDYMLDCLEGYNDTLPDEWLDRMESVERGYSEWVAACDRRIRETEWAKTVRSKQPARPASPQKKSMGDIPSITHNDESFSDDSTTRVENIFIHVPTNMGKGPSNTKYELRKVSETSETNTITPDSPKEEDFSDSSMDSPCPQGNNEGTFDGAKDVGLSLQRPMPTIREYSPAETKVTTPVTPNQSFSEEFNPMDATPISNAGDASPDLPPMPLRHSVSQSSVVSQTSTVMHGDTSHFDLSSDLPEVSASPDIQRTRIRENEYLQASPPSSPPGSDRDSRDSSPMRFGSPLLPPTTNDDDFIIPSTSIDDSFTEDFDDSISVISEMTYSFDRRESTGDQHLRQQISQIIDSIPAKIKLTNEPPAINLNPPDLKLPRLKKKPSIEPFRRSTSSLSVASSRAGTPSFTLSPAKNTRVRNRNQQEIKVYHLARSTGEAPIKLFIRCVGEQGERVMVRVGGGWADLGEYLKEYASHHKRRSAGAQNAKVEVREPATRAPNVGSSPASRPGSALELSPMTPLAVRKTRRSVGAMNSEAPRLLPRTPALVAPQTEDGPSSEESNRSRSSSRLSWAEDDSSFLGLAGPTGKKVEMSEENKAWVESVKQKVRIASGERKVSAPDETRRFGELGKVGGTKRLFRKPEGPQGVRR